MSELPLTNNPLGSSVDILLSGNIYLDALDVAPFAGGIDVSINTYATSLTSNDGYLLLGKFKFDGESEEYTFPHFETESSGGTGGEISWRAFILSYLDTDTGFIGVTAQLTNYSLDISKPPSVASFYFIRLSAKGNDSA